MLEDNWTQDKWIQAVHTIAGQLESGEKVYFRRSANSSSTSLPPSNIYTNLKNGSSYTFTATRLESHNIYHSGAAQVISNDGGLVYQDKAINGKYENKTSWTNAPGGYRTISEWTAGANTTTKEAIQNNMNNLFFIYLNR